MTRKALPGEITPMRWWNWLYVVVGLLVVLALIGIGAYAWEYPGRQRSQKIEKLQQEVKELKEKSKP